MRGALLISAVLSAAGSLLSSTSITTFNPMAVISRVFDQVDDFDAIRIRECLLSPLNTHSTFSEVRQYNADTSVVFDVVSDMFHSRIIFEADGTLTSRNGVYLRKVTCTHASKTPQRPQDSPIAVTTTIDDIEVWYGSRADGSHLISLQSEPRGFFLSFRQFLEAGRIVCEGVNAFPFTALLDSNIVFFEDQEWESMLTRVKTLYGVKNDYNLEFMARLPSQRYHRYAITDYSTGRTHSCEIRHSSVLPTVTYFDVMVVQRSIHRAAAASPHKRTRASVIRAFREGRELHKSVAEDAFDHVHERLQAVPYVCTWDVASMASGSWLFRPTPFGTVDPLDKLPRAAVAKVKNFQLSTLELKHDSKAIDGGRRRFVMNLFTERVKVEIQKSNLILPSLKKISYKWELNIFGARNRKSPFNPVESFQKGDDWLWWGQLKPAEYFAKADWSTLGRPGLGVRLENEAHLLGFMKAYPHFAREVRAFISADRMDFGTVNRVARMSNEQAIAAAKSRIRYPIIASFHEQVISKRDFIRLTRLSTEPGRGPVAINLQATVNAQGNLYLNGCFHETSQGERYDFPNEQPLGFGDRVWPPYGEKQHGWGQESNPHSLRRLLVVSRARTSEHLLKTKWTTDPMDPEMLPSPAKESAKSKQERLALRALNECIYELDTATARPAEIMSPAAFRTYLPTSDQITQTATRDVDGSLFGRQLRPAYDQLGSMRGAFTKWRFGHAGIVTKCRNLLTAARKAVPGAPNVILTEERRINADEAEFKSLLAQVQEGDIKQIEAMWTETTKQVKTEFSKNADVANKNSGKVDIAMEDLNSVYKKIEADMKDTELFFDLEFEANEATAQATQTAAEETLVSAAFKRAAAFRKGLRTINEKVDSPPLFVGDDEGDDEDKDMVDALLARVDQLEDLLEKYRNAKRENDFRRWRELEEEARRKEEEQRQKEEEARREKDENERRKKEEEAAAAEAAAEEARNKAEEEWRRTWQKLDMSRRRRMQRLLDGLESIIAPHESSKSQLSAGCKSLLQDPPAVPSEDWVPLIDLPQRPPTEEEEQPSEEGSWFRPPSIEEDLAPFDRVALEDVQEQIQDVLETKDRLYQTTFPRAQKESERDVKRLDATCKYFSIEDKESKGPQLEDKDCLALKAAIQGRFNDLTATPIQQWAEIQALHEQVGASLQTVASVVEQLTSLAKRWTQQFPWDHELEGSGVNENLHEAKALLAKAIDPLDNPLSVVDISLLQRVTTEATTDRDATDRAVGLWVRRHNVLVDFYAQLTASRVVDEDELWGDDDEDAKLVTVSRPIRSSYLYASMRRLQDQEDEDDPTSDLPADEVAFLAARDELGEAQRLGAEILSTAEKVISADKLVRHSQTAAVDAKAAVEATQQSLIAGRAVLSELEESLTQLSLQRGLLEDEISTMQAAKEKAATTKSAADQADLDKTTQALKLRQKQIKASEANLERLSDQGGEQSQQLHSLVDKAIAVINELSQDSKLSKATTVDGKSIWTAAESKITQQSQSYGLSVVSQSEAGAQEVAIQLEMVQDAIDEAEGRTPAPPPPEDEDKPSEEETDSLPWMYIIGGVVALGVISGAVGFNMWYSEKKRKMDSLIRL